MMPAMTKTSCVAGFNVPELFVDDPPPPPSKPARVTNVLNPHPTATVTLRGISIPLASDVGSAFLSDCARNRERIMSDDAIREKYGIDQDAWNEIIKDKAVRLAVNAESERRVRSGDAARDSAAKLFATAPEMLGKIMNDPKSSPRHVIEAHKELRATARAGDEQSADAPERFIISINIGADEKPIVIDSGPLPKRTQEALDAEKE